VKLSSFDEISADLRNLLLYWVGRCLTQPSHKIRTADGVEIKMIIPDESERTILEAEDGALELPDYQFTFEMTGMGADDAREQVAAALEGTGG
jgi:hypothetical protein